MCDADECCVADIGFQSFSSFGFQGDTGSQADAISTKQCSFRLEVVNNNSWRKQDHNCKQLSTTEYCYTGNCESIFVR